VSGLLAPRGNSHLFTHLAALLAHDPTLRLALGREARRVSKELPWERKFPELEAALLETASHPAAGQDTLVEAASGSDYRLKRSLK
jgi:hypothetical protein